MGPRLFWHVFATEARRQMSYRADFWLSTFVGLIAGIVIPYFLWSDIYALSGQSHIAQFSFEGMLTYYVVAVLLSRVVQGPDMVQNLADDIYDGELSRYLVYPTRYLPFKYAQHVGGTLPGLTQLAMFGMLFTILLAVFTAPPAEMAITPWTAIGCAVSVALGNLLYFLLGYPLQCVAFWADNVWSLTVLLRFVSALLGGLLVPLSLFPAWAIEPLMALPFPYLYWFPVRTLMGLVTFAEWTGGVAITAGWCAAILFLGRAVWKRGEIDYSGVGI